VSFSSIRVFIYRCGLLSSRDDLPVFDFLRDSYSLFPDASSPDAIAREAPDTDEEESDWKE